MSIGHQDALFEAVDYDIEENADDKHLWEKFKLSSSLMLEPVDASAFEGVKVLPTRSVDTVGKSPFVAKESKTLSTDENYAQTTTMATNRLIDVVATRRKHLLLGMDSHRAFLHLEQDELVSVVPPRIWKDAKAPSGRDSAKLWRMKRILYGCTKAL